MIVRNVLGTISREPIKGNPNMWGFTEHRDNGSQVHYNVFVTAPISLNLLKNAHCEQNHERQVRLNKVNVSPKGTFLVTSFSFTNKKEEAIRIVKAQ